MAPLAPQAAMNAELNLLQSIHCFAQPQIKATALCKMAGHLWQLSQNLIVRSMSEPDVDLVAKRATLKVLEDFEREEKPQPRDRVGMTSIKAKPWTIFLHKQLDVVSYSGLP